jgi:hypothetical protein
MIELVIAFFKLIGVVAMELINRLIHAFKQLQLQRSAV